MIYIIYGDNANLRLKARTELGIADIIIDRESEIVNKADILISHIDSIDLWGNRQKIYISNLLEDKDFKDILYDNLESIKNSDNKFIIDEISIHKAVLDKIKKYSSKVYDCTPGQIVNNRGNNRVEEKSPFKLCDYIAARDRRKAWAELMTLYQTDIESEPLHGAIWWKLKIMLSSSETSSNNFTYKPALNTKYSRQELDQLSYDWISISLRAHNGECDFRDEMERWILSI